MSSLNSHIQHILREQLEIALVSIGAPSDAAFTIEPAKDIKFGELASSLPLALSKGMGIPPMQIAQRIRDLLIPSVSELVTVTADPPGFLNFNLTSAGVAFCLDYLKNGVPVTQVEVGEDILLEFVSANPTGDLHLGHGRGAVIGSALANILKAVGHSVQCEYYINDAGEQMNKLGRSAWAVFKNEPTTADEYPPQLIAPYLVDISPTVDRAQLQEIVRDRIVTAQREVLIQLGVSFDRWVSEREEIHASGFMDATLQDLKDRNLVYEQDGALWFRSTELGDERDRVLRKSEDSCPTYLLGDIAYHRHKLARAHLLIDVFGADHQGQELSLLAGLEALDFSRERLKFLFIQFVSLVRDGKELKMSKRTGDLITVREVLEEVGRDAFRTMMLLSSANNRLTFDIDLAKRSDDQNPVFYLQYAHARAASILRNAVADNLGGTALFDAEEMSSLSMVQPEIELDTAEQESALKTLIGKMIWLNEEVHRAARNLNPSGVLHHLMSMAAAFHSFYVHCRILGVANKRASAARIGVVIAFKNCMHCGLELLGVSAPSSM